MIDTGAEAGIVVRSLIRRFRKVEDTQGEGAELLLLTIGHIFLLQHIPLQSRDAVIVDGHIILQCVHFNFHFHNGGLHVLKAVSNGPKVLQLFENKV